MLLTTLIVFAPGCRWMFRITAALSFIHAACRLFSTPLTTLATSFTNTGALFLNAMGTFL